MPVPTRCSNGYIPCGRGSACPNLPASAAAPGVAPNAPKWVMREAYSPEMSSCGFWPGIGGYGRAASMRARL
jgi:hypothetical protein